MSLLACFLVIPAFASAPLPADSLALSPLAEFLAPAPAATKVPVPPVADADSLLSYTYVEVGAARNDVDSFDENVDTYYLRASLNLLKLFYVFGEYSNQSTDFANTDTNLLTLGGGAHLGVLPSLDVYAELGAMFSDVSSDANDLDGSEVGYRLAGGVRYLLLEWSGGGLELDGALGTMDLDNRLGSDDNPTFWGFGARAHFIKFLSVGLAYEKIEDDDQILGGVRWSF
ncbi:MAG: hypothetical protein NTY35_06375 [Planctomycetota bacterium]|nr:hypothetical protein [Planctomycetota bacterium]